MSLRRTLPAVALAAALFCAPVRAQEPADWVDPFIGTTNFGTTNPGALCPNGMMSVVPFNVMGSDKNLYDKDARWWSTPYEYHNKFFTGMAHGALSGVGCPEMGALLTMPTCGELDVDYRNYGSEYGDEVATLDGANVEMKEACGEDNIFIFGLTAAEVENLWKKGYNSTQFYVNNPKLERVIETLNKGLNGQSFSDISAYLLTGSPVADPYMCLADFEAFCAVHERADAAYRDKTGWAKKSLYNIASSGIFAADRSIKEYAERIWHLKRID